MWRQPRQQTSDATLDGLAAVLVGVSVLVVLVTAFGAPRRTSIS